jgi:uncharacterized protein
MIGVIMDEQENIEIVQRFYAAIGQGDMVTAKELLADFVEWQSPVTRTDHVGITWYRPRIGRDEVLGFFKELSQNAIIEPFEDLKFIVQNDRVVVEGRNRGSALATGRFYEHRWVMIFVVRNGKILEQRHYYDTADIEPAFLRE